MGISSTLHPARKIFTQDTAPTNVENGTLWYDTNINTLKTLNSGVWEKVASDVSVDKIWKHIGRNSVLSLRNLADSSLSTSDYSDVQIDVFTSSGGYDSTIDTGNTTSIFNTNYYTNLNNTTTESIGSDATIQNGFNFDLTLNKDNVFLTKIPLKFFVGSSYSITVTLKQNSNTIFQKDYTLSNDGNLNLNPLEYSSVPSSGTLNVDIAFSLSGSDNSEEGQGESFSNTLASASSQDLPTNLNLDDLTFKRITDTTIQTKDLEELDQEPTSYQLSGDYNQGSPKFDISFDGGSSWETNKEINTKYNYSGSGSDTTPKIKIKQNTSIGENKFYGYSLIIW